MDYKNLMVGDYINSSLGIGKILSIDKVGITLINKDKEEFDIDFLDDDEWLQAIPLTEELLQKNFPEPNVIAWWLSEVTINDERVLFHCEMSGDLIGILGEFRYVHELQNALRLCGIDSEIKI